MARSDIETYVKGEGAEAEKVALHEGFEPSATEFRSPCSAVELMERGDETYVGVGLVPLSFAVVINVFFIMPIPT